MSETHLDQENSLNHASQQIMDENKPCNGDATSPKSFCFENIFETIGGFGKYQILVFVLAQLFDLPAAWGIFLPIFIMGKPPVLLNEYDNSSLIGNTTVSTVPSTVDESTSILVEWNLIDSDASLKPIVVSIQMGGMFVGALVTGQLGDSFGRRIMLYGTFILLLISLAATALSFSWIMFLFCRFIFGVSFGGILLINIVLPLEFISPRWRAFSCCVGLWSVGVSTVALIAYFVRDWRHLCWTITLISLPFLITWRFVPESPRWLIIHGRVSEAKRVIDMLAKYNKTETVPEEIIERIASEERSKLEASKRYSYHSLFTNSEIARCTIITAYAWFVCGLTYYGMSFGVSALAGDLYLNIFLSGLLEIPILLSVLGSIALFGRPRSLALYMGVVALMNIAVICLKFNESPLSSQLAQISFLIGRAFVLGAWGAVAIISAEIFPTIVRNIGVGAGAMAARTGCVLSSVILLLKLFGEWAPLTVFACINALATVLVLFLPDTSGKPLLDSFAPSTSRAKYEKASADIVHAELRIFENHGHEDSNN